MAGHSKENPGFLLYISGTGILLWKDAETGAFGEGPQPGTQYDDLDGVEKLTSLPDSAWHRVIDKIFLEAGTNYKDNIKTAVVCPPTIYGMLVAGARLIFICVDVDIDRHRTRS